MKVMNGTEAAVEIHELGYGGPMIGMTGDADASDWKVVRVFTKGTSTDMISFAVGLLAVD